MKKKENNKKEIVDEVVSTILANYNNWVKQSFFYEDQFFLFIKEKHIIFKTIFDNEKDLIGVYLSFYFFDNEIQVGEVIYCNNDNESFLDLLLLVSYISTKIDDFQNENFNCFAETKIFLNNLKKTYNFIDLGCY